jgi:hypothetical protein
MACVVFSRGVTTMLAVGFRASDTYDKKKDVNW